MPRKPDGRMEEAKALFLQGMKLVGIAKKLGLPEGTVRRWKSSYKWDSERSDKNNERSGRKKKKDAHGEDVGVQVAYAPSSAAELSPKQEAFCLYYANSGNATASYRKAYGCSQEAAMASASRLLRNVKVREEVGRLKKEKFDAVMFSGQDIFQWHLDIATASITDYVSFGREAIPLVSKAGPVLDEEGKPVTREINYIKFRESEDVDGRAIKKVKMGKDGASIELYDAFRSMEWLEKNLHIGTESQKGLASRVLMAYKKRGEDVDGRG